MGQIKNYFNDYLSSEDFDLMFDDEYEQWLEQRQIQLEAEQAAYEEALSAVK
jgi:hypothetical protein